MYDVQNIMIVIDYQSLYLNQFYLYLLYSCNFSSVVNLLYYKEVFYYRKLNIN